MKALVLAVSLLFSGSAVPQTYKSVDAKKELVTLHPGNTLTIRGPIDGASMAEAMIELSKLALLRNFSNYTIYIVLDSPGGSIDAGEQFIEYAKMFSNVKTLTLDAASMASAIVEAMPGERLALESSTMMFHRAQAGIEGQIEDGELETRVAYVKKRVRAMEQKNADRIGISLDEYKKKVKDEWWIYGKDLVTEKVADRIVEAVCTKSLIEKRVTKTIGSFFFTATIEFSQCPLIRYPVSVKRGE